MARLPLLVVIFLSFGGLGRAGPIPLAEADKQKIVDAHNEYRAEAGASAMQKMKWNEDLANYAQNAANGCKFEHTSYDSRKNIGGFEYIGENIYTTSGTAVAQPTVNAAVDEWAAEKKDYDLNSNQCSTGMCGHYTQIVWSSTTDVGCALVQCPSIGGFSSDPGFVIFCNYGVGGNMVGEAPYEPASGASDVGSKCGEKFKNKADSKGLCVCDAGANEKAERSTNTSSNNATVAGKPGNEIAEPTEGETDSNNSTIIGGTEPENGIDSGCSGKCC